MVELASLKDNHQCAQTTAIKKLFSIVFHNISNSKLNLKTGTKTGITYFLNTLKKLMPSFLNMKA